MPPGKETVRPADIVAIEVINRLCSPCSEFALAEHWYASTGLEDLLGVPDSAVTKDRLYRTLDQLLRAKEAIENDLKEQLGTLFRARLRPAALRPDQHLLRGAGRGKRAGSARLLPRSPQRLQADRVALVVTRDGFPLAHRTFAGNTQDLQTVQSIVGEIETQFGKSQRVWVMDRGMISDESLKFLGESGRRYLLATKRGELAEFQANWEGRLATPAQQSRGARSSSSSGRRSITCWPGAGRGARRNGRSAAASVAAWRPSLRKLSGSGRRRESSRNATRSSSESAD